MGGDGEGLSALAEELRISVEIDRVKEEQGDYSYKMSELVDRRNKLAKEHQKTNYLMHGCRGVLAYLKDRLETLEESQGPNRDE